MLFTAQAGPNKTKINYLLQNFPLCLHGIVLLRLFGPCLLKIAFVLAKNVIKTFKTKFDEKTKKLKNKGRSFLALISAP
jgi:hypothetical protein